MSYLKILSFLSVAAFTSSSALAQESTCSVPRQMTEKNGQSVYVVNQRARSLYMISRDLYGDSINWRQIAKWNGLAEPYKLVLGQELIIKVPARLNEKEANKVLIQAWTQLDDKATVQKLQGCLPAVAAPVVIEVPVQTPAPAPAPVEVAESAPPAEPTPVPAEPVVTTTPPPLVEKNEVEKTSSKWFWKTALLGSVFSLTNKDKTLSTENNLQTRFNYGAELSLRWQKTERLGFTLGAEIEHVEFEEADSGQIENRTQDFQAYSLLLNYKWSDPVLTFIGYRHAQRPIYQATQAGVTVDSLFIPEANFGGRIRLGGSNLGGFWLLGEGIYSLETSDSVHKIKEGLGFKAGFHIEKQVGNVVFNFTPAFKVLTADTEDATNTIEAYTLNLGLSW